MKKTWESNLTHLLILRIGLDKITLPMRRKVNEVDKSSRRWNLIKVITLYFTPENIKNFCIQPHPHCGINLTKENSNICLYFFTIFNRLINGSNVTK